MYGLVGTAVNGPWSKIVTDRKHRVFHKQYFNSYGVWKLLWLRENSKIPESIKRATNFVTEPCPWSIHISIRSSYPARKYRLVVHVSSRSCVHSWLLLMFFARRTPKRWPNELTLWYGNGWSCCLEILYSTIIDLIKISIILWYIL
jgi:hypothetical protein